MSRKEALTQKQKYQEYDRAAEEVLVDFDGTLCTFQYPGFGPPEPGARRFMKALIHMGLRPIVWSSRLSPELYTLRERIDVIDRLVHWLQQHNIPYHSIDLGDSGKRLCLAYVDDRAVHYAGDGLWEPVLRRIRHIRQTVEEKQQRRRPCGT